MPSETTQGKRVEWRQSLPLPGEYMQEPGGRWIGVTPDGHLVNMALHSVVEHEDGTITVSPSLVVRAHDGGELWHGWLERGTWRAC